MAQKIHIPQIGTFVLSADTDAAAVAAKIAQAIEAGSGSVSIEVVQPPPDKDGEFARLTLILNVSNLAGVVIDYGGVYQSFHSG